MDIKANFKALFQSYSYLLFSDNPWIGALLLILSFINPSAGIHSVTAFAAAALFSKISGTGKGQQTHNLFLYNSLLSGLAIGYLFHISFLSILFTSVVGILTFLMSLSMHATLSYYFRLPILNLPFALIATVVYLASLQYSSLFQAHSVGALSYLNIDALPIPLHGLFKSLGILLFLPYDIVGIILLIVIMVNSRINFVLIILGYFCGTLFHGLLSGTPGMAFANPYSFNYILISLALGGFFLIPSKRTYMIALSGVCISSIILNAVTIFWSNYGIPVFTLPFAITVLLYLHTLTISRFPYITQVFRRTPEENLEQWCNYRERFSSDLPAPRLPFTGEWSVYQGFEDNWTHQGLWRYAVDFVIEDSHSELTYKGHGKRLEDYYCYNKPVLSPVTGTVSVVQNTLPDNPIGTVDKENNWGNHVVIYSDFGYFVELSHLAKDSVTVVVGERVAAGQIIGRCGNSGYSPQPHIHMQVQHSAFVGAPAELFTLSQTVSNGTLISGEFEPKRGDRLSPQLISRKLANTLQFILDDTIQFDYLENGVKKEPLNLLVKMDVDGSYYFEDTKRESRLYFAQKESEFTVLSFAGSEKSPLRFLFTALPSLPLSDTPVNWSDSIPGTLLLKRYPFFAPVLKSLYHPIYSGCGTFSLNGNRIIGETKVRRLIETEKVTSEIELGGSSHFIAIRVKTGGNLYELTAV